MKKSLFVIIASVAMLAPVMANANPEQFEKNAKEFKSVYDKMEKERVKEEMRDKTHDNRLMLGRDTSVGVGRNGVNIIHSTP